jgi:hypothetical protein
MSDVEARSRLTSILDVIERESRALRRLEDPRLDDVLEQLTELHLEILATLAELHHGLEANGDSSS